MKKKVLYTCEICGTDFADKEKAMRCEKSHIKIKEVQSCTYNHCMGDEDEQANYPDLVWIEFEDGKVFRYKNI